MENIKLLNNNVAICRSDMPIRTSGVPLLSKPVAEDALFELTSVKRWQHMITYIDKWAPYGLPYFSSGGVLWDRPILKSKSQRSLIGDLARARKQASIKNANVLQPVLAWFDESLQLIGSIERPDEHSSFRDTLNDEFDMRLRAIDASIDQSSVVIGIEELLAHRDMLNLACMLYRGFSEGDLSDELFALADVRVRKDRRIQVGFPCERLYSNGWIRKRYFGKTIGDRPATFLMETMPAWEAFSLEADFSNEKTLMSYFVICPEEVCDGESAIRFAASVFAATLVNKNTAFSKDCNGKVYLNRNLRIVSDADLMWQIWSHLGELFNTRASIGKCAQCHIPISAIGGQLYCSDACKTAASKARRDIALKYFSAGRSLEDAVETIGERYRSNVERWYKESDRDE